MAWGAGQDHPLFLRGKPRRLAGRQWHDQVETDDALVAEGAGEGLATWLHSGQEAKDKGKCLHLRLQSELDRYTSV